MSLQSNTNQTNQMELNEDNLVPGGNLDAYLQSLPRTDLVQLAKQLEVLEYRKKYRVIDFRWMDEGPLRRELYPLHMQFFADGAHFLDRGVFGGNGSWKTSTCGCEGTYHLTGQYPHWWKGKRWNRPITALFSARENKQLRAGMQQILFGKFVDIGTGLIPKECLLDDKGVLQTWAMAGTANCIGVCAVRHYTNGVFDGWSTVEFKTANQGWEEYQGGTFDLVWQDEEPNDAKVVSEAFARTRSPTGEGGEGIFILSETPTRGFSTIYTGYLPNGKLPIKGIHPDNPDKKAYVIPLVDPEQYERGKVVTALPHISERQIQAMIHQWKTQDPGTLKARLFGYASLGTGRIYPINEEWVVTDTPHIRPYWRKSYGIDPGWNNTAVIWITEDPGTKVKYIYSEYKHGQVVYPVHVNGIKLRGEWICGAVDPHEANKPRDDGVSTINYLGYLGLTLVTARGEPSAARQMILEMFESGALKITRECEQLLEEIRNYRYDENDPNKPAKDQDDHLCDAMLYGVIKFEEIARSWSEIEEEMYNARRSRHDYDEGRNNTTGY
jgi:phage terminase large subunit-like protein